MTLRKQLRKYSILKNLYRSIRNLRLSLYDIFRKLYFKITKKPFIVSLYARVKNFGDLFSEDLLNYLGYKLVYEANYKKSQITLTGSILQMYHEDYNGYVMGSGFIAERFRRNGVNWQVKIIRGPLSKSQLNWKGDCVFGDPGILASVVFPDKEIKKYKLGIVPHSADVDYVNRINFPKDIKIINTRRKAKLVADEIQECEFIASSSLHGLIFADAYCIPNIHIVFGDRLIGGFHKFNDYYLGMDSKHSYLKYTPKISCEDIILRCSQRFTKTYIEEKQSAMLSEFKKILPLLVK